MSLTSIVLACGNLCFSKSFKIASPLGGPEPDTALRFLTFYKIKIKMISIQLKLGQETRLTRNWNRENNLDSIFYSRRRYIMGKTVIGG